MNLIMYRSDCFVCFKDHFSTSVTYFGNFSCYLKKISTVDWFKKFNLVICTK